MKATTKSVLAVAGEYSGDRLLSHILGELHRQFNSIETWGIGGPLSEQSGLRRIFDARAISVMGLGDALGALSSLQKAASTLLGHIHRNKPSIALLINFTEFNTYIGRLLKTAGTRVLWVAAPQVWAWRKGRLFTMKYSLDRLAVLFPFEEPLWRSAGVDAHYIGHPALEVPLDPSNSIGLNAGEKRIALLAGSRPKEIARLAGPLAAAAQLMIQSGDADRAYFIQAPHLRENERNPLHRISKQFHFPILEGDSLHGALPLLPAFHLALCASGTASLEAALAGIPQVVAYRVDALSAAIAKRWLQIPYISLPNILMGKPYVSELLQDDVQPYRIANEGRKALGTNAAALSDSLRNLLRTDSQDHFGARAVNLIRDWID